ncbi:CheY-like superfamily [Ochromonadaceae sp. CCMP2298]|nr:CheY-like superfamily [Ochromonadaceae sp. CCMP2298]
MLVVDDAVSNRKLLMRIFRLKGFVCEEAYDGQDALQKYANMCAQGTPPAAILMDFEMPVLNGPSATRLLREQGCSCLIIGLTGNVMKADKDFFISCGADDVFAKPLNSEFVLKLIAKIATPRAGAGDRGGTGTGGTGDTGTGGTEDTGTGDTGGGGTSAPTSASASLLTPPSASLLPLALTSAATSTSASAYGFGFSSSKITPSADEPDASAPLRPSLTPTHTTPTPTIAQTHTLSPADMHP